MLEGDASSIAFFLPKIPIFPKEKRPIRPYHLSSL